MSLASTTNQSSSISIWERVERVRWRNGSAALVESVAIGCCVVAALSAAVCLLDYVFRWSEPGLRVLIWITFLASVTGTCIYLLWRWRRSRRNRLETAAAIEQDLGLRAGLLTSAIAFRDIEQDDPRLGSSELRRQAIAMAEAEFADKPFDETVRWRSTVRWLSYALAVIFAWSFFIGLAPQSSRIALERLMWPWSSLRWPQMVELELIHVPQVVPIGTEVEVGIINRLGSLPRDLTLEYRTDTNRGAIVSVVPHVVDNVGYHRFEHLQETSYVRVYGGDDRNARWTKIEVVRPAKLEAFHFRVEPPSYTRQSPIEISGTAVDILSGSKLTLRGRFDEPIREARIARVTSEEKSQVDERWQIQVESDGRSFVVSDKNGEGIVMDESIRFVIQWVARNGLSAESRPAFDVRVVPDMPPVIEWSEPAANVSLTAEGKLSLRGYTQDDFGIDHFSLHWQRAGSADGPVGQFPLIAQGSLVSGSGWSLELLDQRAGAQWSWRGSWQPVDALPLTSGEAIAVWFEARDSNKQLTKSPVRTIRIERPAEVAREVLEQQNAVARALQNASKAQSQALANASQLQEVWNRTRTWERTDKAKLERTLQQQETAGHWLYDSPESAFANLDEQMQRLEQNRMHQGETAASIQAMRERVQKLARDQALQAARTLERIVESTSNARNDARSLPFAELVAAQTAIDNELKDLLRQLGQEQSVRSYYQQIQSIADQQKENGQRTSELGNQWLRDRQQSQIQAERARLGAAENDLVRRLEQVFAEILQSSATSPAGDTTAQTDSAMERLREQIKTGEIVSQMRQAAEWIGNNRFSQSAELQDKIADQLMALTDVERGSGKTSAAADAADLQNALRRFYGILQRLKQQQTEVVRGTQSLSERSADPNAREAARDEGRRISESQVALRRSLAESSSTLVSLKAFQWAIGLTLEDMDRAAAAIERLQLPDPGLTSATSAAERLQLLSDAMEGAQNMRNDPSEKPDADKDNDKQQRGNLQSLLLLRHLQAALNKRMEQFPANAQSNTLTPSQWIEVSRLANEQQQLAEQFEQIIEEMQQPGR